VLEATPAADAVFAEAIKDRLVELQAQPNYKRKRAASL
jgi:hypothetical protein